MGTSCLHPKKRQGQVYSEIINAIHDEAIKIITNQNLDHYELLKEKVQRKGYLRKLMDNLSSHRTKIMQAVTQNYKMVIQNKSVENHYAGLIIADCILCCVYKSSFMRESKQIVKNDAQQSSNQIKLTSTGVSNHSNKLRCSTNEQSILRQVDIRFEQIYLKMVIHMMDTQQKTYEKILCSLFNYCEYTISKGSFSKQISQILDKIAKSLQIQSLMKKSIQVYYMLLCQLKQNSKDDFKEHYKELKQFIILWLSKKQNQDQKYNLFQIIRIYIQRSISKWESMHTYQVIVEIFDSKQFNFKEVQQLDQSILEMARGEDLYLQFLKGFMLYLLAYITFSNNQSLINRWNCISWGISSQDLKNKYQNIFLPQSKIFALETVTRLLNGDTFDLNQTLMFNRCSFIYAFTFNLYTFSNQPSIVEKILFEFQKSVDFMSLSSIHAVLQILYEEIQWDFGHELYQKYILEMINVLIKTNEVINYQDSTNKYFIIIGKQFPYTIQIQIINMMAFIIKNISVSKFNKQKPEICQFMYSIYQSLNNDRNSILERCQLVQESINFINSLHSRNKNELLFAYLEKIGNFYDSIQNKISKFFILIYVYQIREVIFVNQKRPQNLENVIIQINKQTYSQKTKNIIIKYVQNSKFPSVNIFKQSIKENKLQQYNHYLDIMQRLFYYQQLKSRMDEKQLSICPTNSNIKPNSIMDNNIGCDFEEDKSFFDIIERIKS